MVSPGRASESTLLQALACASCLLWLITAPGSFLIVAYLNGSQSFWHTKLQTVVGVLAIPSWWYPSIAVVAFATTLRQALGRPTTNALFWSVTWLSALIVYLIILAIAFYVLIFVGGGVTSEGRI